MNSLMTSTIGTANMKTTTRGVPIRPLPIQGVRFNQEDTTIAGLKVNPFKQRGFRSKLSIRTNP